VSPSATSARNQIELLPFEERGGITVAGPGQGYRYPRYASQPGLSSKGECYVDRPQYRGDRAIAERLCACQEAIKEAAKTLRGINSFWIKNAECIVENDQITMYRVNGKISFLIEENR
jgi:flavin-binding protein dodecin